MSFLRGHDRPCRHHNFLFFDGTVSRLERIMFQLEVNSRIPGNDLDDLSNSGLENSEPDMTAVNSCCSLDKNITNKTGISASRTQSSKNQHSDPRRKETIRDQHSVTVTSTGLDSSRLVQPALITDPRHPACGQFGLFALVNLDNRAAIDCYAGIVEHSGRYPGAQNYTMSYGTKQSNISSLSVELVIDAEECGNLARFANDPRNIFHYHNEKGGVPAEANVHACAYKTRLGETFTAIVTKRKIQKGEEILLDYGSDHPLSGGTLSVERTLLEIMPSSRIFMDNVLDDTPSDENILHPTGEGELPALPICPEASPVNLSISTPSSAANGVVARDETSQGILAVRLARAAMHCGAVEQAMLGRLMSITDESAKGTAGKDLQHDSSCVKITVPLTRTRNVYAAPFQRAVPIAQCSYCGAWSEETPLSSELSADDKFLSDFLPPEGVHFCSACYNPVGPSAPHMLAVESDDERLLENVLQVQSNTTGDTHGSIRILPHYLKTLPMPKRITQKRKRSRTEQARSDALTSLRTIPALAPWPPTIPRLTWQVWDPVVSLEELFQRSYAEYTPQKSVILRHSLITNTDTVSSTSTEKDDDVPVNFAQRRVQATHACTKSVFTSQFFNAGDEIGVIGGTLYRLNHQSDESMQKPNFDETPAQSLTTRLSDDGLLVQFDFTEGTASKSVSSSWLLKAANEFRYARVYRKHDDRSAAQAETDDICCKIVGGVFVCPSWAAASVNAPQLATNAFLRIQRADLGFIYVAVVANRKLEPMTEIVL